MHVAVPSHVCFLCWSDVMGIGPWCHGHWSLIYHADMHVAVPSHVCFLCWSEVMGIGPWYITRICMWLCQAMSAFCVDLMITGIGPFPLYITVMNLDNLWVVWYIMRISMWIRQSMSALRVWLILGVLASYRQSHHRHTTKNAWHQDTSWSSSRFVNR